MYIGNKLKERRIALNLTQEELADRCELTKGYISLLENDKADPSIATLLIILNNLNIKPKDFFDDYEKLDKVVFKEDEQLDKEYDGYIKSFLVLNNSNKIMEPLYLNIEKNRITECDDFFYGEEFGYIMEGIIELYYGKKIYKLKKGESFYLQGSKKRYFKNIGSTNAKIIIVKSEY